VRAVPSSVSFVEPYTPRVPKSFRDSSDHPPQRRREERPPLRIFPTTLWEYPSQHYDSPAMREAQKKQRLSVFQQLLRATHTSAPRVWTLEC
jgi:hypothetical protein